MRQQELVQCASQCRLRNCVSGHARDPSEGRRKRDGRDGKEDLGIRTEPLDQAIDRTQVRQRLGMAGSPEFMAMRVVSVRGDRSPKDFPRRFIVPQFGQTKRYDEQFGLIEQFFRFQTNVLVVSVILPLLSLPDVNRGMLIQPCCRIAKVLTIPSPIWVT